MGYDVRMVRLNWTEGSQRGPPQEEEATGGEETLAQFRIKDV